MGSLVTLSEIKSYLGIEEKSMTFDSVLVILSAAVQKSFDRETSRTLLRQTYSNLAIDGTGQTILWLPNWPIHTISSIYEDDESLEEGTDFVTYYNIGKLVRINRAWSEGNQNIVVTYSAGYGDDEIPDDLKLACLKQVAFEWKIQKGSLWGEASRTYPDGAITTYSTGQLLPDVREVLERYKRVYV